MNSFHTRQNPNENIERETRSNYRVFISTILNTFPELELDENSELATLAVEEHNQNLKNSNFVPRDNVPDWFCGFQDVETGELYLSDFEVDSTNLRNINASLSVPLTSLEISSVRFDADLCLSLGTPGSYRYSFCRLRRQDQFDQGITILDVNWSSSFYPTALISTTIARLQDEVFNAVNASILEAQGIELGEFGEFGTQVGGARRCITVRVLGRNRTFCS